MRILILGAPGTGKAAQSERLVKRYRIPKISITDLLRTAIHQETEQGLQAKAATDAGQPVPDEIILSLVQQRLLGEDTRAGFILAGFPRTPTQAEALDALLESMGQPLDLVVSIEVDPDELMERLTGRSTCESCGKVYNIYTSPPIVDDMCDKCGGRLHHRADENEETISNRLRVYGHQAAPLRTYYQERDKLRRVEGTPDERLLFQTISKLVDARLRELASRGAADREIASAASVLGPGAQPEVGAPPEAAEPTGRARVRSGPAKSRAAVRTPRAEPSAKKAAPKKSPVKKAPKKKAAAQAAPATKKAKVSTGTKRTSEAQQAAAARRTTSAQVAPKGQTRSRPVQPVKKGSTPKKKVAATRQAPVPRAKPTASKKVAAVRSVATKKRAAKKKAPSTGPVVTTSTGAAPKAVAPRRKSGTAKQ